MMFGQSLMGTTVLVTGGAGFIGSHLVDALAARGAHVRVVDNFTTGLRSNLPKASKAVELRSGDIRSPELCRRVCEGVQYVFHQAALGSVPRSMREPALTLDVNVRGTANVFAAARDAGVQRVVYASSSAVYGDSLRTPKREGEEGEPISPYGLSKRMNEELATVFARCYGMSIVGLRYFNVYGPRQRPDGPYAAVVPRFVDACRRGESPVIYGDGSQSRDFTFVDDVVAANLCAAAAPIEGAHAVNVGGGTAVSVSALARQIGLLMGRGASVRFEPARDGDVPHSRADPCLAKALLGFAPATSLEAGLALTLGRPHARAYERASA